MKENYFFDEATISRLKKFENQSAEDADFLKFQVLRPERPDFSFQGNIECLWSKYKDYAPKGFKKSMLENKNTFFARWWEMYCGVGLLNLGIDIDTRDNVGPDLFTKYNGNDYHIECIAPTIGTEKNKLGGDNPDKLPPMTYGVFTLPENQFLLRLASAISTKQKKYAEYLKEGKIQSADCLIIAISGCNLSQYGALMDHVVLAIDKVLYGVGDEQINIFTGERSISKRKDIVKANYSNVEVTFFEKSSMNIISGIIYHNEDLLNLKYPKNPEKAFYLRANPNAKNRLHDQFIQKFILSMNNCSI